ncbi:MAG: glycoside hydrolase family 88 protein [Planctomycetales bacterium]
MTRSRSCLLGLCCGLIATFPMHAMAQTNFQKRLDESRVPKVIRSALGVTRKGNDVVSLIDPEDLDPDSTKTRVLLIGGLDKEAGESTDSVRSVLSAAAWFHGSPTAKPLRDRFIVSAVPCVNPDGYDAGTTPKNLSDGEPRQAFPPNDSKYSSPTDPEAAYLRRWLGMHAPDLVVVVTPGEATAWRGAEKPQTESLRNLHRALRAKPIASDEAALVAALASHSPCNVGTIPALQVAVSVEQAGAALQELLAAMDKTDFRGPSPARAELRKRLNRGPERVAKTLAKRYGHDLKQVSYIPALALIARVDLGELTGDDAALVDVERIVGPYFREEKAALSKRPSGSNLAGQLIFARLARATGKKQYEALAQAAADQGFNEQGQPLESMPSHNQMSDAVFMSCPILAQTGRLTGDSKYLDMSLRHLQFMRALCVRKDGLYRHSPNDEAAWGRGNGFPALGLALVLDAFPKDHAGRAEILDAFREHLEALRKHQDPVGSWRQVIDKQGSYRELTSTCMIGFAAARGVSRGWLDRERFEPVVNNAWKAVRTRIAEDASLVDVCAGTGKQRSLRAYYDRGAILGPDARGGAMALTFSVEMIRWNRARKSD